MSASFLARDWLRLPGRIALLLGFGALSAASAQASAPEIDPVKGARVPQQSAKSFGELAVWSEGGRIFFSEAGRPPQELRLGDTAEARQLKQVLQQDGAAAATPRVLLNRIILVGGGGEGFHWAPPERDRNPARPEPSATTGFNPATSAPPTRTSPPVGPPPGARITNPSSHKG